MFNTKQYKTLAEIVREFPTHGMVNRTTFAIDMCLMLWNRDKKFRPKKFLEDCGLDRHTIIRGIADIERHESAMKAGNPPGGDYHTRYLDWPKPELSEDVFAPAPMPKRRLITRKNRSRHGR